jgi:hypothetical protein
MVDHGNVTNLPHTATNAAFGRAVAVALPIILFAVILLFGILVGLRYAHGWIEVMSEVPAATTPMAADGLVAFVSALITAGMGACTDARLACCTGGPSCP